MWGRDGRVAHEAKIGEGVGKGQVGRARPKWAGCGVGGAQCEEGARTGGA